MGKLKATGVDETTGLANGDVKVKIPGSLLSVSIPLMPSSGFLLALRKTNALVSEEEAEDAGADLVEAFIDYQVSEKLARTLRRLPIIDVMKVVEQWSDGFKEANGAELGKQSPSS